MRARTNCLRLQLPQTDIQSALAVKVKSNRGGANVSVELNRFAVGSILRSKLVFLSCFGSRK